MSCRSSCCWFGTFGTIGLHWGLSADLRLENEVHPKILNLKDLIGFMFFFLDRGNDFVILVLPKSWLNQAPNLSNDLVLGEDDWRSDRVESSKIKDHWINNYLGGRYRVWWDPVELDPSCCSKSWILWSQFRKLACYPSRDIKITVEGSMPTSSA